MIDFGTKMYKVIDGNLITLAEAGTFEVVTHGVNCFCNMGAGIAPQMVKAFGCDKFELESPQYRGLIDKLGRIDYEEVQLYPYSGDDSYKLIVVNSYSQYRYGRNHADGDKKPIDYDALTLCMRKINHQFKGKHIGIPHVIGCGLAGGDKDIVIGIIKRELKDMEITMVNYKP